VDYRIIIRQHIQALLVKSVDILEEHHYWIR
jgi:hypothetical protein